MYTVEVVYVGGNVLVFKNVSSFVPDVKAAGRMKITYHDHSTITHLPVENVLYYSQFKTNEYDKEKANSSLPERPTHR